MSSDALRLNWFDLLFVITLLVGVRMGRKHGMSEEILPVMKWLALLIGCALAYKPLGLIICNISPVFSTLNGYLIAYVAAAMVIGAYSRLSNGAPARNWSAVRFLDAVSSIWACWRGWRGLGA